MSDVLYKDETGHISGWVMSDGFIWISEFFLLRKYRGKGLARELARHLPRRCRLLASPYTVDSLPKTALIEFYESLGFILSGSVYTEAFMERV
jgi:GNAT superfamily N-acetyltransferase